MRGFVAIGARSLFLRCGRKQNGKNYLRQAAQSGAGIAAYGAACPKRKMSSSAKEKKAADTAAF